MTTFEEKYHTVCDRYEDCKECPLNYVEGCEETTCDLVMYVMRRVNLAFYRNDISKRVE